MDSQWFLCQIILKQPSVTSTTYFNLLTHTNPSHDHDANQWARTYFCILSLAFFLPIVPPNHLIIIVNIIVIITHVYLLLCYKPKKDKMQRKEVIHHCIITHILHLKVIRQIFQKSWVFFNLFSFDILTGWTCEKTCEFSDDGFWVLLATIDKVFLGFHQCLLSFVGAVCTVFTLL